ncbi:MAG: hypothetical protein WB662_03575 [Methyloceanibacter sp.]
MSVTFVTDSKASPQYNSPDRRIQRQIDDLQDYSRAERTRQLGQDFFKQMKDLYTLSSVGEIPALYFRPNVSIPQFQKMMMTEATDLSADSPKIYILKDGKEEKGIEDAFDANWKQGMYNNRIFEASLWSLFCNVGWLQLGFDPFRRGGKGMVYLESRDPETVFPDPASKSELDWNYVIWEDYDYLDNVKRMYPKGILVKPRGGRDRLPTSTVFLDLPPGPMTSTPLGNQHRLYSDTRVRKRHLFIFDQTREQIAEESGISEGSLMLEPKERFKYPRGRWITECEGVVIADGPNPFPKLPDDPRGTFPLLRVQSLPGLYSIFGPPPAKYSLGLQELAERLMSQTYENAVRMNNGVWFIDENTGIDKNVFGGVPGEIQIINAGSTPPKQEWPQNMPAHMTQLPQILLALQKELQGFSQARSGQTGTGNTSVDLFDASLFQSQFLTRLRARLLAESIQRLSQMVFQYMAEFLIFDQNFVVPDSEKVHIYEWSRINSPEDYEVVLDPGSITPLSGAALRSIVMSLAKTGILPTEFVLKTMDIPGAAELAQKGEQQMALSAMAKLKKPR